MGPEMQKCTTCAERGADVRCVLVEHQPPARVRAKATKKAAAAPTADQQQTNVLADQEQLVASPVEMSNPSGIVGPPQQGEKNTEESDHSSGATVAGPVPKGYAPPTIIIRGIVSPEEVKEMFRMYVPSS